ncbi:MAG: hypothetical protein DMG24_02445 [Acidobacteria bacterium]|nr:MAG: hypothetical protein DMG24_02445 [Acidobacteriota bacterium]
MSNRFRAVVESANCWALPVLYLAAAALRAQTGSRAPDPILLDSRSAARMLLSEVKPEYPALAKVNYIQGSVRMQLRVTPEGRVVDAHVIHGHPFLAEAALQAVRRWVYRPLRRGSAAAEFSTFVDVKFALHTRRIDRMPPQPERDLDRQVRPPVPLRKPASSDSGDSVRMRVLIGAKGQILDTQPLAGAPSHFAAAREQVEHWTFRPARWGSQSVPWYVDIDVPVGPSAAQEPTIPRTR